MLCCFAAGRDVQVETSEDPAVQVVLRADTRRTELLAEEKRLTEAVNTSDDPALQAALNKVPRSALCNAAGLC